MKLLIIATLACGSQWALCQSYPDYYSGNKSYYGEGQLDSLPGQWGSTEALYGQKKVQQLGRSNGAPSVTRPAQPDSTSTASETAHSPKKEWFQQELQNMNDDYIMPSIDLEQSQSGGSDVPAANLPSGIPGYFSDDLLEDETPAPNPPKPKADKQSMWDRIDSEETTFLVEKERILIELETQKQSRKERQRLRRALKQLEHDRGAGKRWRDANNQDL